MEKSQLVSDYISEQEKWTKEIKHLRKLIFEQIPYVRENIKWKIPFYDYLQKPFVYLNPKESHLILGFVDGAMLEDDNHVFDTSSHHLKCIRHILITMTNDSLDEQIAEMLQKAAYFIETNSK